MTITTVRQFLIMTITTVMSAVLLTMTTVMRSVLLTITTVKELDDDYFYDDYLYRHASGGYVYSSSHKRSATQYRLRQIDGLRTLCICSCDFLGHLKSTVIIKDIRAVLWTYV